MSAGAGQFLDPQTVMQYERKTQQMKMLVANEKRAIRQVKTQIAHEIERRNQLERYLRQCVDDVKKEIQRKR